MRRILRELHARGDTADDVLILLELVRAPGAGALLPDLVLAHDAPGVAVRAFAEGVDGREVFLLTRQNRPPVVAAVSAALRGAARRRTALYDAALTARPDAFPPHRCGLTWVV